MSAVASPTELTGQSQYEESTIAKYSFLHVPQPTQNGLKWVPIFDIVQGDTGLNIRVIRVAPPLTPCKHTGTTQLL